MQECCIDCTSASSWWADWVAVQVRREKLHLVMVWVSLKSASASPGDIAMQPKYGLARPPTATLATGRQQVTLASLKYDTVKILEVTRKGFGGIPGVEREGSPAGRCQCHGTANVSHWPSSRTAQQEWASRHCLRSGTTVARVCIGW